MKKLMIICLTFALTLTMLTACTQNQDGRCRWMSR